jgi:hypothetical protein
MRWTSHIAISLVLLTVAGTARAGSEDEVRALFTKFVAAQNAHDLKVVGELLQDSPDSRFSLPHTQLLAGRAKPLPPNVYDLFRVQPTSLYPRKRTFVYDLCKSALCQKRT